MSLKLGANISAPCLLCLHSNIRCDYDVPTCTPCKKSKVICYYNSTTDETSSKKDSLYASLFPRHGRSHSPSGKPYKQLPLAKDIVIDAIRIFGTLTQLSRRLSHIIPPTPKLTSFFRDSVLNVLAAPPVKEVFFPGYLLTLLQDPIDAPDREFWSAWLLCCFLFRNFDNTQATVHLKALFKFENKHSNSFSFIYDIDDLGEFILDFLKLGDIVKIKDLTWDWSNVDMTAVNPHPCLPTEQLLYCYITALKTAEDSLIKNSLSSDLNWITGAAISAWYLPFRRVEYQRLLSFKPSKKSYFSEKIPLSLMFQAWFKNRTTKEWNEKISSLIRDHELGLQIETDVLSYGQLLSILLYQEHTIINFLSQFMMVSQMSLVTEVDPKWTKWSEMERCIREYCAILTTTASSESEREIIRAIISETDHISHYLILTEVIRSQTRLKHDLITSFLLNPKALGHFRLALRHQLGQHGPVLTSYEFGLGLSEGWSVYSIKIHVLWNIQKYIQEELSSRKSLGDVLTISGGSGDAALETCASYTTWRWPKCEIKLYEAIDAFLEHGSYEKRLSNLKGLFITENTSKVGFDLHISGHKSFLKQVALQMAWLTAALCPFKATKLFLADSQLIQLHGREFEIGPARINEVYEPKTWCWHRLVGNASIAHGWEIPLRKQTRIMMADSSPRGLEISFELMTKFARVSSSVQYGGLLALFGVSSLLYPSNIGEIHSYSKDQARQLGVQWHLETCNDSSTELDIDRKLTAARIELKWARIDFEGQDGNTEDSKIDVKLLCSARTFLGYYRSAKILTGTDEARYNELVESGLECPKKMTKIRIKGIELASSGLGIFGPAVVADVCIPRSMGYTPNNKPYDEIIATNRRQRVLIFDVSSNRGWLVSKQRVYLHLIRLWLENEKISPSFDFPLPEADENTVLDFFKDNYRQRLRINRSDDTTYFLRNLVERIWEDLMKCRIVQQQRRFEEMEGLNFRNLWRFELLCWELTDFVNRPDEFMIKKLPIGRSESVWSDLAQDGDLVTLVCRGLGDLIVPGSCVRHCAKQPMTPQSNRLLTASLSCLKPFSDSNWDTGVWKSISLTRSLFWNPHPVDLLEECTHREQEDCPKTKFSVQLLSSLPSPLTTKPRNVPTNGAVVFGPKKSENFPENFVGSGRNRFTLSFYRPNIDP